MLLLLLLFCLILIACSPVHEHTFPKEGCKVQGTGQKLKETAERKKKMRKGRKEKKNEDVMKE